MVFSVQGRVIPMVLLLVWLFFFFFLLHITCYLDLYPCMWPRMQDLGLRVQDKRCIPAEVSVSKALAYMPLAQLEWRIIYYNLFGITASNMQGLGSSTGEHEHKDDLDTPQFYVLVTIYINTSFLILGMTWYWKWLCRYVVFTWPRQSCFVRNEYHFLSLIWQAEDWDFSLSWKRAIETGLSWSNTCLLGGPGESVRLAICALPGANYLKGIQELKTRLRWLKRPNLGQLE